MRFLYRVQFRRDHGWAPNRMSDYLDGELAAARRARLERHMADCPECERLLAELGAVVQGLSRLSSPAAGADAAVIAARVRVRLEEPPPPSS